MSIFKAIAFRYEQHKQEYLSLVMPLEVIGKISKVLIYGQDKYGYQRKLNERHYKGIKKDIITKNVILPTSVILSVDRDYIKRFIRQHEGQDLVDIEFDMSEANFRVVDGQHRIKGLEEAAKENESYNKFPLNVIILITEPNRRVVEVETFRDINSLAKKIKTDLTLLAIHNYELIEQKNIEDINRHIAVKSAHILNEKIEGSVWSKAIQFDIHLDNALGIISVSAFSNSIYALAKSYVELHPGYDIDDREALIRYADQAAQEVASFINSAWNRVQKKWSYCFKEKIIKESLEYVKSYYDEGYYLQKTTGTNAIHMILQECVTNSGGLSMDAIEQFSSILKRCSIKANDWQIGGMFSGLTSSSGFKKAEQIIKENITKLTGSAGTGKTILENWDVYKYQIRETDSKINEFYAFDIQYGTQSGYISICIKDGKIGQSTTIDCDFDRPLGAYNDIAGFKGGLYEVAERMLQEKNLPPFGNGNIKS